MVRTTMPRNASSMYRGDMVLIVQSMARRTPFYAVVMHVKAYRCQKNMVHSILIQIVQDVRILFTLKGKKI